MSLVFFPRPFLVDISGVPRVGAKAYLYDAGTTTAHASYTTPAFVTPHANPVVSLSNGLFPAIYVDPADGNFKLVVKDSADVTIYTEDDQAPEGSGLDNSHRFDIAPEETVAGLTDAHLTFGFDPGDARRYGYVGNGVADDTTAVNTLNTVYGGATGPGGTVYIPPGICYSSSQIAFVGPARKKLAIWAYGVTFKTSGAIAGIQLRGGASDTGGTLYGAEVDHEDNATATAGIELKGTIHWDLVDCGVYAENNSATYSAVLLHNSTPSDSSTGCVWSRLTRVRVYGKSDDLPNGIHIRSAANAAVLRDCVVSGCLVGVHFSAETGSDYIPNAVLIDGTAFESYGTAIKITDAATDVITGLRITGNRFENGLTAVLDLGAMSSASPVPTYLAGNFPVSNSGTYVVGTTPLYSSLDTGVTPALPYMRLVGSGLKSKVISADLHAFIAEPYEDHRGYGLNTAAGTEILRHALATGGVSPESIAPNADWQIAGVKSFGASATPGHNLWGTATFAAATTVAVAFATAEPDANYDVYLTTRVDPVGRLWAVSHATTGFTITNSSSTSIAVKWLLIRHG